MKTRISAIIALTLLMCFTVSRADTKTIVILKNQTSPLKMIFENYFLLKDALVKTDGKMASAKAKDLLTTIKAMKTENLNTKQQTVWMKVNKQLSDDTKKISETEEVKKQRAIFANLSKNMHDLIKVANYGIPVYYQFCPMANNGNGANWLSKEKAVKNPYYGSRMLSCGSITETIE